MEQIRSFPGGTHPLENDLNNRILAVAKAHGYRAFLVGGYVRDALIYGDVCGVKDLDYAVVCDDNAVQPAMRLAVLLSEKLDAHFVPLDLSNDTARVVLKTGEFVDLAGCVGGSIESDVKRRDFSINALVWNPDTPQQIIDYTGGLPDLDKRLIRAVSEQSFVSDPLRLLRAFRFAATIDGAIEEETMAWICTHAEELRNVAAERISYELFSMLARPHSARHVLEMAQCGLLEIVFPELVATRRVTPNAFHHLGLFDHSIDTIPQLEEKLKEVSQWVKDKASQELSFGVTRLAATKVACILHDIGKPATWEITPEGRHTFYTHDKLGAEMCEPIAQRLKWSRPVGKFIVNLVQWHLRPGALFHQGLPTDKAVRRFYRSLGDDVPELMLLAFADFGATRGPGLMGENRAEHEKSLFELLEGFQRYKEESRLREKLLNGNQIMELLSLGPGPVVGELLTALEEAQEFKEVSNRSDAERFVKAHYEQRYPK